jgi:hypothetical protein
VEVGTSKFMGGTSVHNKRIGFVASGAYAPGPDDEELIYHSNRSTLCSVLGLNLNFV